MAAREGNSCCMGKEGRPGGHRSGHGGSSERRRVGFDSGLGEHADEAGGLVAPCLLKAVLIGSCWKCFDSSLSSFPMGMLQLNLNSCGVCEAHIGMSVARWYGGAILAEGVTQAE